MPAIFWSQLFTVMRTGRGHGPLLRSYCFLVDMTNPPGADLH